MWSCSQYMWILLISPLDDLNTFLFYLNNAVSGYIKPVFFSDLYRIAKRILCTCMNFSYQFSNKSFSGAFQLLIVFIAQITSCSNYNKSDFSSFSYRSSSNPTASVLTFTVSQICIKLPLSIIYSFSQQILFQKD